jgi:amidase
MKNLTNRRSFLKNTSSIAALSLIGAPGSRLFADGKERGSETELYYKSATEVAKLIVDKKISSVELTTLMLERIGKIEPKINAINVLLAEQAMAKAKEADSLLAKGKIMGPLHGVPMTIKDTFRIKDVLTTVGNPALSDYVPDYDAVSVARLKAAGAVILGNTNVPYMLDDHQSFNEIYGRTNNPWNLGHSPGGSTGGGATALAAGISYLSLGSDTAGSIRVPAHFCGIFGHKPTLELVPKQGQIPPMPGALPYSSNGLSVAGPLARSTEDLKLLLEVCGGPVSPESVAYSWKLPKARKTRLQDYKIRYVLNDKNYPVSSEMNPVMSGAVQKFQKGGAKLDEGWPDGMDALDLFHLYMYLIYASASKGASIDQIEAYRSGAYPQDTQLQKLKAQAFTDPHKLFVEKDKTRLKVREMWQEFFKGYDAFIIPTAIVPAYPHSDVPWDKRILQTPDGDREYDDMFFWISFATLAGLPATVIPVGTTATGLPVGLQVIGPYLEDATPIHLASLLSEALGGIQHPPGYN